jgi:hypothetical protein
MRAPDSQVGPFRERNSVVLRGTFVDNATPPAPIPGTALTTATLTLYSEKTAAIINGRDHVDIKGNVDAQGRLVLPLDPADTAIVDGQSPEYHRALLEWSWMATTLQRGSWEIRIIVRDVTLVT